MGDEITLGEFLKAIQKPCRVFAQVRYTDDDTIMVQVNKSDLIYQLKQHDAYSLEIKANAFQDSDGDWIIN